MKEDTAPLTPPTDPSTPASTPPATAPDTTYKQCATCNDVLPMARFYTYKGSVRNDCKQCHSRKVVARHRKKKANEMIEEATTPAAKKPYGDVSYADPGYQADGKKRYPINTADHVRAAWSYINQPGNASKYTSQQVSKIKARIRSAAKKFGVTIGAEAEVGDEILAILETLTDEGFV